MTDLTVWIGWLMLGVNVPAAELGELLDAQGIAAEQAAESSIQRREVKDGLVACTAGGDPDAEERAKIIAKRVIAAKARANVAGFEKLTYAYNAAITGRSAGANTGNWMYVSSPVTTRVGGNEMCVAYIPKPPERQ